MILYHTSDRVIQSPDIHRGRKNADFDIRSADDLKSRMKKRCHAYRLPIG